jgi:hypothetical protein
MTPDRLSREYFEGKSLVQGQSDAVVAELRQPTGWADALLQLPVWLGRARRAAAAVDEGSGERASDDPEAFARHCWRLQVLGHAQERVQLMRRRILLQPL